MRRTVDPLGVIAGFLVRVEPGEGCWPWRGAIANTGYGRWRTSYAHRLMWQLTHGQPVPAGYEIDHLCRVRACIRPDHLEAVTPAENRRRQPNTAAQIARTHCPHGHPYSGPNLITRRGKRECRTCTNERNARNRIRRRAA